MSDFSSAAPSYPISALTDGSTSTSWRTAGTLTEETEYVVLDAGSVREIGAVSFEAGYRLLFPAAFTIETSQNGSTWTTVASVMGFRARPKPFIWQFEQVDARYVRISGPGVYYRRDRLYYWEIAEVKVFKGGGATVRLTWTAPADDGYVGTPASGYNVRCGQSPITGGNFGSCVPVPGIGAPVTPGSQELYDRDIGMVVGKVYFALKAADEIPNWSALSNVAHCEASINGFASLAPDDGITADASNPPVFEFAADSSLRPVFISFSSCPQFPPRPTKRPDGQKDSTKRYPIRPGASSWTP
ncbi:MAG: discoidin domain-containing protein, partial [Planctomycetota bacterium]